MNPANRPAATPPDTWLDSLIEAAKREDLGGADLSTALMAEPDRQALFELVAKQPGVFAGAAIIERVALAYDASIHVTWVEGAGDGTSIAHLPQVLARLHGRLDSLLAAERVLLNFAQRLSGIATLTRRFVDAVAGTEARILDTRKTTPGLRWLERHAVRCGGGENHRDGLFDAVLLKDNHLEGIPTARLAGEVFQMLGRLSALPQPPRFIEVEARSPQQAAELFKVVGIDIVLLDNFAVEDMAAVVRLRNDLGLKGRVALEASGGVRLDTVRAIAMTGVECISVGALTHSAPALDLSLERVAVTLSRESAPR